MEITNTFLASVVAFIITYISVPAIIKLSDEKGLYDEPDGERKDHKNQIPALGGIAIFGGFVITTTFFLDFAQNPELGYAFSAITILFFTGLKDDIIPLTPKKKFIAQLLSIAIIIFKCDIRLTNMYGVLGIEEISYFWSVLLSGVTLLGIVNAFNLIDGINGLAGGLAIIISSTFGVLFWQMNQQNLAIFAFALGGASAGFLMFNFRNKIFMGDTGSLTIGLIAGIFSMKFIELSHETNFLFKPTFAPVFAFAVLIIPLFDTLRVISIRLVHRKSPFRGDRNHIHHFLIDIGFNHIQASVILYVVNIFFILMAWSLQTLPQLVLLISLLSMATAFSLILYYFKTKKALESEEVKSSSQVPVSGMKSYAKH